MTYDSSAIQQAIRRVKQRSPLIHNITNFVVMQTTANMLLACGASPLMAHAPEELQDLTSIADALVLNIGTLDKVWIESMKNAQTFAHQNNKPVILDPVGAGASRYRTQAAIQLLKNGVSVLRGNASEILALYDASTRTKGVDSMHDSEQALYAAQKLAHQYQCIVVISGETDFVCTPSVTHNVTGGDIMLTRITGMGCSATALIGAFVSVNDDPLLGCVTAMSLFKKAAELSALRSEGPGSFATAMLDAMYKLTSNSEC